MFGTGRNGVLPWIKTTPRSAADNSPMPNIAALRTTRREQPAGLLSPKDNRLLAALPCADFKRLQPHLERVALPPGMVLKEPGVPTRHFYFPVCGLVSLLHTLADGATTEIAVVGHDGYVGVSLLLGEQAPLHRAVVQIAGYAYRVPDEIMLADPDGHGPTRRLLLGYVLGLVAQISQIAVCNRHHTVEQQLCRWLLLRLDRMPSHAIDTTQEVIGRSLGVRRATITDVVHQLQASGVIEYRRGHITVPDRALLEAHACECYAVIRKETDRLQRPHGAGASRRTPVTHPGKLAS